MATKRRGKSSAQHYLFTVSEKAPNCEPWVSNFVGTMKTLAEKISDASQQQNALLVLSTIPISYADAVILNVTIQDNVRQCATETDAEIEADIEIDDIDFEEPSNKVKGSARRWQALTMQHSHSDDGEPRYEISVVRKSLDRFNKDVHMTSFGRANLDHKIIIVNANISHECASAFTRCAEALADFLNREDI